MARIIVIGGIESTYRNAQVLHDLGENILMFYTRGPRSPGWEGVDPVDEARFSFSSRVKRTEVNGHINDHINEIRDLKPDFIYSLGWQQICSRQLLGVAPFIGIHESLLPEGAGAVPIANAILHGLPKTGVTLFWLEPGIDTGHIIGQLACRHSPRTANATQLYEESMQLEEELLKMYVPKINNGTAPRIPQDFSKRTVYRKVTWTDWPAEVVSRARVYPYA